MLWIYLLFLLVILVISVMYHIKGMIIRVFGFELIRIIICVLVLALLIGEILLPMPSYYIKHQGNESTEPFNRNIKPSLNKILEEEVQKSGIEFDAGSFKIIGSHGLNFDHLFLISYQIDGKEEVRVFHFEKNILGNMRPKYSFNDAYIIPKNDSLYRVYVKDGIFGEYIVTAGFASEETVLENYRLNDFRIDEIYPQKYFMWVDLVGQPWKSLIKIILLTVFFNIIGMFIRKDRKPIKLYCRWQKGDKILQCVKEDVNRT